MIKNSSVLEKIQILFNIMYGSKCRLRSTNHHRYVELNRQKGEINYKIWFALVKN